jgi:8-oxo-dGTP pyrophosphatase MutT (NUDIX family)
MNFDFTAAEFRSRAARGLLTDAPPDWNRSDDDMNLRAKMIPDGIVPKPASVLIGIIDRPAGPTLLLTQRTAHLSKHAGQIAFPGGRRDEGETAVHAALRETEEETGLDRNFVEVVGFLDGYLTVTGYVITPVVALVREGFTITPHAHEVDEVFEVPLSFLMNRDNLRLDSREFKGVQRHYYVYPYKDRYIWGATAGMLKNLCDRLYELP